MGIPRILPNLTLPVPGKKKRAAAGDPMDGDCRPIRSDWKPGAPRSPVRRPRAAILLVRIFPKLAHTHDETVRFAFPCLFARFCRREMSCCKSRKVLPQLLPDVGQMEHLVGNMPDVREKHHRKRMCRGVDPPAQWLGETIETEPLADECRACKDGLDDTARSFHLPRVKRFGNRLADLDPIARHRWRCWTAIRRLLRFLECSLPLRASQNNLGKQGQIDETNRVQARSHGNASPGSKMSVIGHRVPRAFPDGRPLRGRGRTSVRAGRKS